MIQAISARLGRLERQCVRLVREAHTYSRQDRGLYNGTEKQFGNSVSESHKKSARTWLPNVHGHTLYSATLRRSITLRMPASVWRTIQSAKYGGSIDKFLTSSSKSIQANLGLRGTTLRNEIVNVTRNKARVKSGHAPVPKKAVRDDTSAGDVSTEEHAKMEGVAAGM